MFFFLKLKPGTPLLCLISFIITFFQELLFIQTNGQYIIALDRNYTHQTVNHLLTFVAPDGTHTNSIESTWRAAKRQFKEMNGVSRLYLQAYLDEYYWRLANGNRDGWLIFSALIKAIKAF